MPTVDCNPCTTPPLKNCPSEWRSASGRLGSQRPFGQAAGRSTTGGGPGLPARRWLAARGATRRAASPSWPEAGQAEGHGQPVTGSPPCKSCQCGKGPPVNTNVNSIILKERQNNHIFSLENIEFTFAFTGGSFAAWDSPWGRPVWPARGQPGLLGPAALAVRCLAWVSHCLAQGLLESWLWPAPAVWPGWLALAGAGRPFGDAAFGSSWRRLWVHSASI